MKKLHALFAVIVAPAFVACAETTPFDVDAQFAKASTSRGVSSPNTTLNGTITIQTGDVTVTYLSAPRNANGTCAANGVFVNNGGHASKPNHTQCTETSISGGTTVTIRFTETVNYVLATSGNIQLNFAPQCFGIGEEQVCFERSVQYRKNSDWTEGVGILYAQDNDGNMWEIDLGQIGAPGNAEMLARSIGGLQATMPGSSAVGVAALSW